MSHQTLDMCGYNCPMPILKTKQALAKWILKRRLKLYVPTKAQKKILSLFVISWGIH